MILPGFKAAITAAIATAATAVFANGLHLSPVNLTITERSGIIRLANVSDAPIRLQIRVFEWTQINSQDQLTASDDLLASPPFVELGRDAEQVVRVVRSELPASAPASCERAYRVKIDQLPESESRLRSGIRYRMSYSIPVFVARADCVDEPHRLSWQLENDGTSAWLIAKNEGARHARIGELSLLAEDGTPAQVTGGLLGYVLPASRIEFPLPDELLSAGRENRIKAIKVVVNGEEIIQNLQSSNHPAG